MVCLNEKLPINLKQMRSVLIKEIDSIIEHELYFLEIIFPSLKKDLKSDENIYNNKINKLKKNIIKDIKNKMDTDYFLYRIIDDKHCTFKHSRGKNEGNYCCKKIKTNLIDNKEDYLCCTHSKKHIPKKKSIKIDYNSTNKKENTKCPSSIDILELDQNKNESNIELLDFVGVKINNSNIPKINKSIIQKKDEKNNNITYNKYYKKVINNNGQYITLSNDIPLVYFWINKIKKIKNKYNFIF